MLYINILFFRYYSIMIKRQEEFKYLIEENLICGKVKMKGRLHYKDNYAVSEVVGGILLVLIALVVFSIIYMNVTSEDIGFYNTNVIIVGSVNDDGIVVLEHKSGDVIKSYKVSVSHPNGTLIGSKTYNDEWKIGENRYPLSDITDIKLVNETISLIVSIHTKNDDGQEQKIFEAELFGKVTKSTIFVNEDDPYGNSTGPLLISSLRNNTTDEDLICYDYNIQTDFDPSSYIYNWFVDSQPLTKILLPFDKNDADIIRDFSSHDNNATNHGSSWSNDGVIGGCYQFSGNNYISLPYVFSSGGYADDFTIEFWIKTTQNNAVLVSYLDNNMFNIKIIDGMIQWDTFVQGSLDETKGKTVINDGNWHHIALSYASSNGVSEIFIDGILDESKISHNPGDRLGEGTIKTGFIGKSNDSLDQETWDVLTYDDFESGWGSYTDGGWYCSLYTSGTYAHQGSNAACIERNQGWSSSFYYTNSINVESYNSIQIDFWLYSHNINERGKLFIKYYDGSQWINIREYNVEEDFQNNQFQQIKIMINKTEYNFPTNMKLRFECHTSSFWDNGKLYLDQIYVNATIGGNELSNYSGFIDEFAIYNKPLSYEQIYQNYLCKKEGNSNQSVIVSDETTIHQEWNCKITPVCETQIGDYFESNKLTIKEYDWS